MASITELLAPRTPEPIRLIDSRHRARLTHLPTYMYTPEDLNPPQHDHHVSPQTPSQPHNPLTNPPHPQGRLRPPNNKQSRRPNLQPHLLPGPPKPLLQRRPHPRRNLPRNSRNSPYPQSLPTSSPPTQHPPTTDDRNRKPRIQPLPLDLLPNSDWRQVFVVYEPRAAEYGCGGAEVL